MKMKSRIAYIDIAKGIGMLAVIWGHILTSYSSPSVTLVYAFDIPLFFVLSGMMYNGGKFESLKMLMISRVRSLIIPYIVYSVATWALWAAMQMLMHSNQNLLRPLLQTIMAQGSGGFMIHNVPLWFVTCLFVVEILYYFVSKTNDVLNISICILLAVCGYSMLHTSLAFDFTKLPWNIESAMSAILFYCMGNLYVKHFKLSSIHAFVNTHRFTSLLGCAIALIVFVMGALINGHITLGSNELGKCILLLYVNGLLGSAIVLVLSALVDSCQVWKDLVNKLKWIGMHSFDFMAVHVPIKGVFAIALASVFHSSPEIISNTAWQAAIVYALTLAMSTIVVFLISRLRTTIKKQKAHRK